MPPDIDPAKPKTPVQPIKSTDPATPTNPATPINPSTPTNPEQLEWQFRVVLEGSQLALWSHDLVTNEYHWSAPFYAIAGINSDIKITKELFDSIVHPDDVAALNDRLERSTASGMPCEHEFRITDPAGQVRWLYMRGQVRRENRRTISIGGVVLDITDQHSAHYERMYLAQRQTRAAEHAVRMQRVTAALSEAMTVSQVRDVLLIQGCSAASASCASIGLLDDEGKHLVVMQADSYNKDITSVSEPLSLDENDPLSRTVTSREPVLITGSEDMLTFFPDCIGQVVKDDFSAQAVAAFPLLSDGKCHGAWSVSWAHTHTFAEGELIILLTLAAQGAQALDRARLYEREQLISLALQRTLRPSKLPMLIGASAAQRYQPMTPGVEVGGDWYDVISMPDNRVGLVVGDVGGHNIDAAAVMGQLRNVVRSYAWEGHSAGTVLEMTNRLLAGSEPGVLATCCYAELNLDDGIVSVALAGHPPPLVVSQNGHASFVNVQADPPLGTEPEGKYGESSLFLAPYDSIVLYTDGLIESRTVDVVTGMRRLAIAAATEARADPETLADHLLSVVDINEKQEDDVALLVLRYEVARDDAEKNRPRYVKRHLSASAASAGVARRFSADVMNDWGAAEFADPVSLLVSELVTNALVHTATAVELVLRVSADEIRVEVSDHSDRIPIRQYTNEQATSGRGLQIVEAVASQWGVEVGGSGKTVWFRLERSEYTSKHTAGAKTL